MAYKVTLNKNKNIGKVVFIVEGDKKEHSLLSYVFKEILDYSIVDVKRDKNPYEKYISKQNPESRIFVVSSMNSNIASAGETGKEFLDRVFSTLFIEYSLDITNAAVYYIFDRDNESNLFIETEKLTKILKNSRDNEYESNGLLLLSYPCIEAYIKTCIDDCPCEMVETPKSLKSIVASAEYQYSKLCDSSLICSCINMLFGIEKLCGRTLTESDLDDFAEIGCKVLSEENDFYLTQKQYMILSLLSVAFIDLGIISVVNE